MKKKTSPRFFVMLNLFQHPLKSACKGMLTFVSMTLIMCVMLVLIARPAVAQTPFYKTLCQNYASDVLQNSDSGYVVLSERSYYQHYDVPPFSGTVYCGGYNFLDSNGDSLNGKCWCSFPLTIRFSTLLQDSAFCLYGGISGNWAFSILKMDNVGDTIWYHTYPFAGPLISIKKSIDSSYICLTDEKCFKINLTGDTIWTMQIDSNFSFSYGIGMYNPADKFIVATADTGFIIFKNQYAGPYNYIKFVATKYNSSNNTVWTKDYFIPKVSSLTQTSDGSFILSCNDSTIQSAIVKLDQNADSSWTKWFPYEQYNSIAQTADYGFIISCGVRFKIIKTDVNGDTLWTSVLIDPDSLNNGAKQARETFDHGFVVCGFRNSQYYSYSNSHGNGNEFRATAIVIKTDSLGINVAGLNEVTSKNNFTIFPNPFSKQATIRFSTDLHSATLRLYNLYGQLVQEKNNISGKEILLTRENLGSGVYVYEVTDKDKKICGGKAVVY